MTFILPELVWFLLRKLSLTLYSNKYQYIVHQQADLFEQARDCLLPMGITSENVAQRYGVTREEQDHAAVSP